MKSRITYRILATALLLIATSHASAGEVEAGTNGGTVWNAGLDGVVIEWDEAGDFSRIYSKYTQPASIPNTRGIRTAKTIAEEKAKAAIIRFLDQTVTSRTFTAEVTEDIETSSAIIDGDVSVSSEAKSSMLTSLSEFTSSVSQGNLRGVIRLEEGYDNSSREAWVKVGFSNKTMRAASSVRNAIANDGQINGESVVGDEGDQDSDNPSSHVRKTEQRDW